MYKNKLHNKPRLRRTEICIAALFEWWSFSLDEASVGCGSDEVDKLVSDIISWCDVNDSCFVVLADVAAEAFLKIKKIYV